MWWWGPGTWAQGWANLNGVGSADSQAPFQDMTQTNGISEQRSQVKVADITDGTSHTYLVGEKYLNPDSYAAAIDDGGDDQSSLTGDSDDIHRWTPPQPYYSTYYSPRVDTSGYPNAYIFGSPHMTGFNMAFCDGAVKVMNYAIDPVTHSYLGSRNDGHAIDAKKF
jgi:prepilin-type processing-associated H-X9-DG protein